MLLAIKSYDLISSPLYVLHSPSPFLPCSTPYTSIHLSQAEPYVSGKHLSQEGGLNPFVHTHDPVVVSQAPCPLQVVKGSHTKIRISLFSFFFLFFSFLSYLLLELQTQKINKYNTSE